MVVQPLLRTVPIPVGAGVRLSQLIDAIHGHGRDAVAKVTLERPAQGNRPLRELGADAEELIATSAWSNRATISRGSRSPHMSDPRWNASPPTTIAYVTRSGLSPPRLAQRKS